METEFCLCVQDADGTLRHTSHSPSDWFEAIFRTVDPYKMEDMCTLLELKKTHVFPSHSTLITLLCKNDWYGAFWCLEEATPDQCIHASLLLRLSRTQYVKYQSRAVYDVKAFFARVEQLLVNENDYATFIDGVCLPLPANNNAIRSYCLNATPQQLLKLVIDDKITLNTVFCYLEPYPSFLDRFLCVFAAARHTDIGVILSLIKKTSVQENRMKYMSIALSINLIMIGNCEFESVDEFKYLLHHTPHTAFELLKSMFLAWERSKFSKELTGGITRFLFEEGKPLALTWMFVCDIPASDVTPALLELLIRRSRLSDWNTLLYDSQVFFSTYDSRRMKQFKHHLESFFFVMEHFVPMLDQWNPTLLLSKEFRSFAKITGFTTFEAMKCLDRLHARNKMFLGPLNQLYSSQGDDWDFLVEMDEHKFLPVHIYDRGEVLKCFPVSRLFSVLSHAFFWLRVFQRKCKRWYDTPNIWREDLDMWVSRNMLQQYKNSKKLQSNVI